MWQKVIIKSVKIIYDEEYHIDALKRIVKKSERNKQHQIIKNLKSNYPRVKRPLLKGLLS